MQGVFVRNPVTHAHLIYLWLNKRGFTKVTGFTATKLSLNKKFKSNFHGFLFLRQPVKICQFFAPNI